MNVLIVGLGYAGNRFLRALNHVANTNNLIKNITIGYVDLQPKKTELKRFISVSEALVQFKPDIIIITVNDMFHAEILNQLQGFNGFIICEKPLANCNDNLDLLMSNLSNCKGFCFDLIERYSNISIILKDYIAKHQLQLIRAHFYWGKDRINDYRPTCGVTSEVIHALDLIQYINNIKSEYQLSGVLGTCSDFSISGQNILDSVTLTAYLDKAVITGYSSFVNINRKREIDLTFVSSENRLIYTQMIFDTPEWDIDYLKVWEKTNQGEKVIIERHTQKESTDTALQTIEKLVSLVNDVISFVQTGKKPNQPFPDIKTAIQLQYLLNNIEKNITPIGPVKYVYGTKRECLIDEHDLERLG